MTLSSCRRSLAAITVATLLLGGLFAAVGASRASAATPACTGAQLVETIDPLSGGATAGTVYFQLKFTNLGGTCELRGYPGVSAVNLAGRQLGRAAVRQTGKLEEITLKAATASSAVSAVETVGFVDTGALSGCDERLAAGLRVYAPGSTTAKYVPFVVDACSSTAHAYIELKPIT
jgi:hypothetical protein